MQSPSLARVRFEFTRTKHQVVSHCVGTRIHIPRRLLGGGGGMHAHPRKVVAKPLLHLLAQCRLEWLAGTGQSVLHTGGCRSSLIGRSPSHALAADWGRRWRCQDLIGDPVCFLFVDIPRLVYFELSLDHP
jgi:hypothetical protein